MFHNVRGKEFKVTFNLTLLLNLMNQMCVTYHPRKKSSYFVGIIYTGYYLHWGFLFGITKDFVFWNFYPREARSVLGFLSIGGYRIISDQN